MKYFFAFLMAGMTGTVSIAQQLQPGMAAPSIQIGEWVKGTPVNNFNKDSIYVLEFWATWCGPCKEAIPHLTELSKKYPGTHIIGVSIAETNTSMVKPFVDKMGDRMNYTVAIDKQESATARKGYMSTNWLAAAGLNGIPASFVIANNEIAWIGYPMQLDSVLEKVNDHSWDTKTFASKWKKDKEAEDNYNKRIKEYTEKSKAHAAAGNKKELYKTLGEELNFFTNDAKNASWSAVNEIIWNWIADPAGKHLSPEMKDYQFAIKWMEKLTARAEGKDPAFFDTLAWCYYGAGNKQKAIDIETKAMSMLPANYPARGEFENALRTFQQ